MHSSLMDTRRAPRWCQCRTGRRAQSDRGQGPSRDRFLLQTCQRPPRSVGFASQELATNLRKQATPVCRVESAERMAKAQLWPHTQAALARASLEETETYCPEQGEGRGLQHPGETQRQFEHDCFTPSKWVWFKINPLGDRRFWSMFPLTRVPFLGTCV